jgi:hypothetical protein
MIKLISILKEVYPYKRGQVVTPNFQSLTKDIDNMYRRYDSWEKFEREFRAKFRDYPKDDEANQTLKDLWMMYKNKN